MLQDKIPEKFENIKRRKGLKDDNSVSEDEEERALFAKTFKERYKKKGKFGHNVAAYRSDGKKGSCTPSNNKSGGEHERINKTL